MTSPRFPILRIRVELAGRVFEENALLDTGFDGEIVIPKSRAQGLQPDDIGRFVFPDGTEVEPELFKGVARLNDLEPVPVEIIALGAEFIVGIRLLSRYEVILDHGQRVIVNP